MGLFDLVRSKSKNEKLSHLKSIMAMALADGHISQEEKVLVAAICKREGLTMEDVTKCLDCNIVYPTDADTRRKYLIDMLAVMVADGVIDDNEVLFFKVTARALNLEQEAKALIISAQQAINK